MKELNPQFKKTNQSIKTQTQQIVKKPKQMLKNKHKKVI